MATPGEIRDQLLRDLRATRTQLMSPAWITKIRDAPKPQKQAAGDSLMKVQLAILDLENQALATFRDELQANEAEITKSTEKMKSTLAKLESTAKILDAVSGFLRVLARVVTLF